MSPFASPTLRGTVYVYLDDAKLPRNFNIRAVESKMKDILSAAAVPTNVLLIKSHGAPPALGSEDVGTHKNYRQHVTFMGPGGTFVENTKGTETQIFPVSAAAGD